MKDLVEVIVKNIVDNQKAVTVNEVPGENTSIIEILVDKTDLGKVIGKEGRTAQAIRSIIYASAFKTRKRYTVDINAKD